MKSFNFEDRINIECSKKIEENISSMLKDLMNSESSGDENNSKSDSEICKSNIDIISFESSLPLVDNSKFINENFENIEIYEIDKFQEKSFDNNINDSFKQNEFNDSLKLNHRNFSPIKNLQFENRSYNTSMEENITDFTNSKKSIFYLNDEKLKKENLFVPKNFRKNEKNFSFFSQNSQLSQDIFGFSQDQNLSFDIDFEKIKIDSKIDKEKKRDNERKNSSLFDRKIFKTQINNKKNNQIYLELLNANSITNNSFNKNNFSNFNFSNSYNNYTSISNSNSSYKNESSSILKGNSRRSDPSSNLSLKK
jgi:hypothetical protein